jgi:hypothetical protein
MEYVNNQQDMYVKYEDDMSHEAQMLRINEEVERLRDVLIRQQIYDYQNPAKLMKQKFTHIKKLGGVWNNLEIDDEHKAIFIERVKLIKVGLRGGITKVENAKKGEKEDIRIYWK